MKKLIRKIYRVFSVTLMTILSFILFFIIFTIALSLGGSVFLIKSLGPVTEVSLPEPAKENSSYIYGTDKQSGKYSLIYKATPDTGDICMYTDAQRLPEYIKDAFVCIEDERFYTHDGVDIRSTSVAIAEEFLRASGIMPSEIRGGSTITQQLVKNITKDDEVTPQRKLREIIRAINLEQKYTKDEILEKYLNIIYFGQTSDGYNMYGIESAAHGYFNKSANELSVVQAAILAAIPQNPEKFNPLYENNENLYRASYCLEKMFQSGVLSPDTYQKALEELNNTNVSETECCGKLIYNSKESFINPEPTSWVIDTALSEFCDYLCKAENISRDEAMKKFMNGGYELYLTVDSDIQSVLEKKYSDYTYFTQETASYTDESGNIQEEKIQSAFVVMDYTGQILGIVGRIGEKNESFCWNNAIDAHRQPGSTIKPLTVYGYGIENDKITWSSYFYDSPLIPESDEQAAWPQNYTNTFSENKMTVDDFLTNSYNTLPAKLCSEFGADNIFRFATDTMKLQLNPQTDMTLAGLSIGATGTGPSLINITNSYIPFGNGGIYYKAHIINRIKDAGSEQVYLENASKEGIQVIGEDTAYIMNRMLRNVIVNGTGQHAALSEKELIGKTGTTENFRDIMFIGLTPDFVSSVWTGYENGENQHAVKSMNASKIWKDIFGDYADNYTSDKQFPVSDKVISAQYCAESGLIANRNCPVGGTGYYKSSSCRKCEINHPDKFHNSKNMPQ